ncbi:TRAP-type C4-dicarboxylate transport system, substrate-binding protein [Desulfatibacillum alkenivorans DSM 16219]|uniref:TRAP-type C4-dicarboxylate transport system, substrate-binding protein n=1 Tax=Desulfatibacillum alkenivorans DSM 16219 TaxID=1121393 RepID=A0A1M6IUY7_9BACT|nr:TRAP-type C4-dicarboxylate transport system, substrate-binding protein [Desulfatibacillum alkenivorans DSM 16219]
MVKKQAFLLIVWAALFSVLLAMPAGAEEWKDRWKFGTIAPDGIGWAKQIKNIVIPAVEEATQGTLEVKVYWGGVMGDDEDFVSKMRIGQLQGAGWSGQGVLIAVPEMEVVTLPFLFNNYDEVDYIKQEMSEEFDEIAKKNGYMCIAWIDEDICSIYSTKYDMSKLQDYKDAKILSWFGDVEERLYKSLGASPISVNMPEAPPALRQGVGDAITASAAWILGTQLYSSIKYVSPYKLRYAPAMIAVDWKTWSTMPEPYKDHYYKIRADVVKRFVAGVRSDNAKSLQAMKEYGLKEMPVSPEEMAAIRKNAVTIWQESLDSPDTGEILEELLEHLEDFRAK